MPATLTTHGKLLIAEMVNLVKGGYGYTVLARMGFHPSRANTAIE